jgi:hypothetical protein
MNTPAPLLEQTRRHFFQNTGVGIGSIALAGMLKASEAKKRTDPLAPKPPHFPAKAKRDIHGATDGIGYIASENPVHVHDLQATILNQLGLDHTRLTYRFQGRDFRLTDVHGQVVKELLV